MTLAPYAVSENNSRGREHPVNLARDRNAFQRDLSRITHSAAFRRLQGKTQVFSSTEGDRFRTRITHSQEVENLSESICAQLKLNVDLARALALGHDIGHPPFGHLGQDVLDELMKGRDGFEHNLQALRLVDELESPYLEHLGLNLMFETREGLLKHCTRERARALGPVAARHLDGTSPPLEVQVVDWADAIAYCHADLEDAFMMGLLDVEELRQAPGYNEVWSLYSSRFPGLAHPAKEDFASKDPSHVRRSRAIVCGVIREMITLAVDDLIVTTRSRLAAADLPDAAAVRRCPPLVAFSDPMRETHYALKKFSRERIYSHKSIVTIREKEARMLKDLFLAYVEVPSLMSGRGPEPSKDLHRAVCDHLAGMTDRFAYQAHEHLRQVRPDLVSTDAPEPRSRRPSC